MRDLAGGQRLSYAELDGRVGRMAGALRGSFGVSCGDRVAMLSHSCVRAFETFSMARTGADPVTEPFTDRVDAAVSASTANRALAAALAKLPATYRDTLLLVTWGDPSYEEAALALVITAEMTLAGLAPHMARFRPHAETSLAAARAEITKLAAPAEMTTLAG
jgi:acyl-CoA synthetase (AMP-forming)/AMP-acid ligase II